MTPPKQLQENVRHLFTTFRHNPSDVDSLDRIQELVRSDGGRREVIAYLETMLSEEALAIAERNAALILANLTEHHGSYRASFGELDITPALTGDLVLQGYDPPRHAEAISSPLASQLLLLEDEGGHKTLIVSADLFGFGTAMVDQIRKSARDWGIPADAVLLNASHTHYAPGTVEHVSDSIGTVDLAYSSGVASVICQSIEQLYATLEPCFIYHAVTEAQIGVNRCRVVDGRTALRPNPDGYYHGETPVLVVDFISSATSVTLVSHGCHPTGLGSSGEISAGYPGYLRTYLVQNGVAEGVMVLQGAAGTTKQTKSGADVPRFADSVEDVIQNASTLAEAVVRLLTGSMRPVTGGIFAKRVDVELPYASLPTCDFYRRIYENPSSMPLARAWAHRMLMAGEQGRRPSLKTQIQLLALGDETCLVSLAGEPGAELARDIIESAGLPEGSFFLGYTNGIDGYFLTHDVMKRKGYESDTSVAVYNLTFRLSPSSADVLTDAVGELVDNWRTKDAPNGYGRYELAATQGKAFFCLSTGRCGTQSLKHVLDTASNARVYHHPQPYLIEETLAAYHGTLDAEAVFWRGRGDVIRDAWNDDFVFGELDHNMTPFMPAIADSIPSSRFLVLVRNPWDFVRSGMRRGYYRGHAWDPGRLRPEAGHPDAERWATMSPFEKTCWLWNDTYERIFDYLKGIPDDRYRIVRFEKFTATADESRALFDWLGLEGFDENRITEILGRKLNKQTGGEFPRAADWTEEQHEILLRACRSGLERFGYRRPDLSQTGTYVPAPANILFPSSSSPRLLFLEQEGISTGGHLDHIEKHLSKRYSTTYLKTTDLRAAAEAVDRHDFVWLEWASPLTAAATKQISTLRSKPVVCRLHGFEVFTDLPNQIDWSVVDQLIFVAEHKRERFFRLLPNAAVDSTVIRNGVVVDRYSIPPGKKNTKKLLLLGHINYRKGLDLLMHFYQQLLRKDPEYELYIRGDWQDARYRMAIMTMVKELRLQEHVTFVEEWIDDLDAWMSDKSHILSFSLEESFHYAVGNGMAAGMKPVVHAWNESRSIWPEEFIFSGLDDFLELMLDETYEPERYRSLLLECGLGDETQLDAVDTLIAKLMPAIHGTSSDAPASVRGGEAAAAGDGAANGVFAGGDGAAVGVSPSGDGAAVVLAGVDAANPAPTGSVIASNHGPSAQGARLSDRLRSRKA